MVDTGHLSESDPAGRKTSLCAFVSSYCFCNQAHVFYYATPLGHPYPSCNRSAQQPQQSLFMRDFTRKACNIFRLGFDQPCISLSLSHTCSSCIRLWKPWNVILYKSSHNVTRGRSSSVRGLSWRGERGSEAEETLPAPLEQTAATRPDRRQLLLHITFPDDRAAMTRTGWWMHRASVIFRESSRAGRGHVSERVNPSCTTLRDEPGNGTLPLRKYLPDSYYAFFSFPFIFLHM